MTNSEKIEIVFASQIAENKPCDGNYVGNGTDTDCIKSFVVHHKITEEEAEVLLQKKKDEWAEHVGERLFFFFKKTINGAAEYLEVINAWESELIQMFDEYDFILDATTSALPYAIKKSDVIQEAE